MAYSKLNLREISDAISVLMLDRKAMSEVFDRKRASVWGLVFLFFPSCVNLFLLWLTFPTGFGAYFSEILFWKMLIPPLSLLLAILGLGLVATRFKKGFDYIGAYRVLSYASIFIWVTILPFLFDVLGIGIGSDLLNFMFFLGFGLILMVAQSFFRRMHSFDGWKLWFLLASCVGIYFVSTWALSYLL